MNAKLQWAVGVTISVTSTMTIAFSGIARDVLQSPQLMIAQNSCSGVPKVDPWKLQKPVLFGNTKAAHYYKGVVLAGEAEGVQKFLNCYNLTVKARPDYASSRPIWAACQGVRGPGGERGEQIVCVAVDRQNEPLDSNIFSKDYADKVADKVFNWF